jgi:NADPH:quinone reductase-like Zn-dependent oxidoreductase
MQAVIRRRYGSPAVLELGDLEKPSVDEDNVLVHVRAAAVNPVDWHRLTGMPYLVRAMEGLRAPKEPRIGADFAGVVETVGRKVERLQPGDEVFGVRTGAFGEYVTARDAVVAKPRNVSFAEAAAVPIAALTALQGLRDKGDLREGQKVLVNGASGGVGTFAVQIAKALGAAEVVGVCRTGNLELVRSLGADRVIDYTREDFTACGERFDAILDIVSSRPWGACRRILAADGTLVVVGAAKKGRVAGSMAGRVVRQLLTRRSRQKSVTFIATPNNDDLEQLAAWLEDGSVKPFVERELPLSEVAEAMAYVGAGHARGKVVLTV